MKLKIKFELNTDDIPSFNSTVKEGEQGIKEVLSNIGQWLQELQNLPNVQKLEILAAYKDNEYLKNKLLEAQDEKLALAEQIFHNYQIDGVMENGDTFSFSHSEPGYKENFKYNNE